MPNLSMMASMSNQSPKTRPKRRWMQFSMRTMLVVVSLSCVALAVWVVPAERQRRAIEEFQAMGGRLNFVDNEGKSESFPIAFLRRWLPQPYFDKVEVLWLDNTEITDDGLAHMGHLIGLRVLNLDNTQITDAGLAHLKGLTALQGLYLENTHITDTGLAHLKELTCLQQLHLGETPVTDAGLAHLERLTALSSLYLGNTQVTDDGLAHLKGLTALQSLDLENTQITDAGLAHLEGLTGLRQLDLANTQVTDNGLAHLQGLTALFGFILRTLKSRTMGSQRSARLCRTASYPTDNDTNVEAAPHNQTQTPLAAVLHANCAVAGHAALRGFEPMGSAGGKAAPGDRGVSSYGWTLKLRGQ